jgi:transcriptional regulator with XRE-family HTH domain
MDDGRFGAAIRAVRHRRGWRQTDLGAKAGVSGSTISRLERGHPGTFSLDTIRAVARALDIRVDLSAHWRAGDLDRLLNARHSALHDLVATWFGEQLPAWVLAPEVSFNVYGERGVIDIVAWHPGRRALLVIELKTDITDVNELLGTLDRKRRLARDAVKDRGWDPASVSVWLIVAGGRTNRARLSAHRSVLRAAFPAGVRAMRSWLADPVGPIAGVSTWSTDGARSLSPVRRIRRPRQRRAGDR